MACWTCSFCSLFIDVLLCHLLQLTGIRVDELVKHGLLDKLLLPTTFSLDVLLCALVLPQQQGLSPAAGNWHRCG
jgi:hypothetical protein